MKQERVGAKTGRQRLKMAVAAISAVVLLMPLAACRDRSDDNDSDSDKKVSICHFGGHEGDFVVDDTVVDDTVVGHTEADCESQGGNVLSVSENALGGHGIGG